MCSRGIHPHGRTETVDCLGCDEIGAGRPGRPPHPDSSRFCSVLTNQSPVSVLQPDSPSAIVIVIVIGPPGFFRQRPIVTQYSTMTFHDIWLSSDRSLLYRSRSLSSGTATLPENESRASSNFQGASPSRQHGRLQQQLRTSRHAAYISCSSAACVVPSDFETEQRFAEVSGHRCFGVVYRKLEALLGRGSIMSQGVGPSAQFTSGTHSPHFVDISETTLHICESCSYKIGLHPHRKAQVMSVAARQKPNLLPIKPKAACLFCFCTNFPTSLLHVLLASAVRSILSPVMPKFSVLSWIWRCMYAQYPS